MPDDARRAMASGVGPEKHLLIMAEKSENTKTSEKTRETYSESDIGREITTEFDRTAVPLTMMNPASSLRKSPADLDNEFSKISNSHSNTREMCITMGLDVDGWSPNANRKCMLSHHQYVYGMTDYPDKDRIDISREFDKILLIFNRKFFSMWALHVGRSIV